MKNKYLSILFILVFAFGYGQKETANWFFGQYAGLNFSSRTPVAQKGNLNTLEGCASISNAKGALLFYTDGSTIWNRNHEVMPNGTGLFGQKSSTQAAIIVPKPESKNIYYVFTVSRAEYLEIGEVKNGINYSIVDMNLNNGKGDVIPEAKNIHLVTYDQNDAEQKEWKGSEKISATLHFDGISYWILTYFVDTFYAFKLDENGLNETPVKTKVNDVIPIVVSKTNTTLVNLSSIGYLKLSPNGKKIAIAHSFTGQSSTSGRVFLYDFDPETGKTSTNGTRLISSTYPYGVEFSPKSRKVYVSTNTYVTNRGISYFQGSNVYQFDLESQNILGSRVEIHNSTTLLAGALQLALDGKIYRSKHKTDALLGESSLAAITKPELNGRDAAYIDNAVTLASGSYANYGLPPFISSAFLLTFDFEFTCIGDETHFFITSEDPYDTVLWDFGDGTTSTDPEPYHRYASPGEYEVSLTTLDALGNDGKPMVKKIEIVGKIEVLPEPYVLIQCDTDEEPEDGITTFNLQLANDPISLGRGSEVDVFYYTDMDVLANDSLNIKALPNFYKNNTPDEPLLAKVVQAGSDCYNVADIILKATKTIDFVAEKFFGCNQGDGTAIYDLASRKEKILTDLGLSPLTEVTYHASMNDAALGYEPLAENYIGSPSLIYIRLANDNICSGIGKMDLDMPPLPRINLDEEYDVCMADFPIKINGGVEVSERQNYSYEWLSGEQTYEIEAEAPGTFYLTITDNLSLCSTVKSIYIKAVDIPVIRAIELDENGTTHTASVLLEFEGDFEFALDNSFGPYQDEPVFDELPPGSYTVFIRDRKSCNIVAKKFFIFGFPKFFTPNSDGQADVWEVRGLNPVDFNYSDIQIFNRFGKLIASFPPNGHWDGTYNGKTLPSDDYWFTVTVTDSDDISTTYIKHFSLLRN
ncbi:T9SS type B sorting domain-containing protein [Lutimonas vermicola]|uniref:T9SS type B sorting domain-containing protein n=1 Tax=Lutimonas vermicola TaxID=414288 RepID=A0ABU9L080_9FLAO